jgi:protein-S-isoprenylcysteine O-methyltransferase Ste14
MKDKRIIVWLTVMAVAALGELALAFLFKAEPGNAVVRKVGWGLLALSAFFVWLPLYQLKKWGGVPKRKSRGKTTVLVDRGVYAIVRHPHFLLSMAIDLALILIAQHWLVGVLGAIAIVACWVSALEEEKSSIARFGDDYRRYMESVPRFNFILGAVRALKRRSSR